MVRKIGLFILGLLLIVCGVLTLSNPFQNLIAASIIIGVIMLFAGIVKTVLFIRTKSGWGTSWWVLVEGILLIIFGTAIVLSNNVLIAFTAMLPIFYASWILISGVLRIIGSITLKKAGIQNWWALLITGILDVLLGVMLVLNLGAAAVVLGMMISLTFIFNGIGDIILALSLES